MNKPPLDTIKTLLINTYQPTAFTLEDESQAHANHPGMQANQYHLILSIKAKELNQLSIIDAHKHIYQTLHTYMPFIHALSIKILK